jgi:hypothetical protein
MVNVFILDKTVPPESGKGHQSLTWILNYNRITKPDKTTYSVYNDYYGYYRQPGEKEYSVRSLRLSEILSVVDDIDVAYYTDTYSLIPADDENKTKPDSLRLKHLYGGLNQNDFLLLSELRRKKKLIITEYNLFDVPTSDLIRKKAGDLFDLKPSGWVGTYVKDFSLVKTIAPAWIAERFKQIYPNLKGEGLLLANEKELVVLDKTTLTDVYPQIHTNEYGQNKYQLPAVQNFTGWFDIVKSGSMNKEVAYFKLPVNAEGETLLKKYGISAEFPAVVEHLKYYKFYYFAGDFSTREVNWLGSHFIGVVKIGQLLNSQNVASQKAFFWRYYYPLVTNIINNTIIRNP